MDKTQEDTDTEIVTASRRDQIRLAAEAILSEERRAGLEARMRQKKMRLLSRS